MSNLVPTFETVFTEEYWAPVSGKTEKLVFTHPSNNTLEELNPLLTQAAISIFQGASGTIIEARSSLSPQSGEIHTLPGSILLADVESIMQIPGKINYRLKKSAENEDRLLQKHAPLRERAWITDDPELQASPRSLFLKNAKNHLKTEHSPGYLDVWPYNKLLLDHEEPHLYRRVIGLLAVAPDRKGFDRIYRIPRWGGDIEDGKVIGTTKPWRPMGLTIPQNLVVRQTMEITEKDSVVGMIRVKHAELCAHGALSRVAQKQKLRPQTLRPIIGGV